MLMLGWLASPRKKGLLRGINEDNYQARNSQENVSTRFDLAAFQHVEMSRKPSTNSNSRKASRVLDEVEVEDAVF